jgi:hypothetical protein
LLISDRIAIQIRLWVQIYPISKRTAAKNTFSSHSSNCTMASSSTSSSSALSKTHQRPSSSPPVRGLLDKLVGRSPGKTPTLPRKLASVPFAASLLCSKTAGEAESCRLQLQRVANVVVLDATRDKKSNVVLTLQVSLKESPRAQTGIFVPNNAPVAYKTTRTFQNVNQLGKLLAFCVDKAADVCGADCAFCTRLREYLQTHWVRDPLVAVTTMDGTVIRKPSLAMHLAQLVAFATGASPRVLVAPTERGSTGVQLAPRLYPHGQSQQGKSVATCEAQVEVAAVLLDFFDVFPRALGTTNSASAESSKEP